MSMIKDYIFKRKGGCTDSDVLSFINTANVTENIQKIALCNLVTDLKHNNLWDKIVRLYPIIGNTANKQTFELKTKTNGLTFRGYETHTDLGFSSTQYVMMNVQACDLNQNSNHIAIYTPIDIGAQGGCDIIADRVAFHINGGGNYRVQLSSSPSGYGVVSGDSKGFFCASRVDAISEMIYKNGVKVYERLKAPYGVNGNTSFMTGNYLSSPYSARTFSFISIGQGFTDAEHIIYSNIVTEFCTTLGKN